MYKFIRTGEAKDIGVAIDKGCRAPDLLAVHLVTPFSLGAFVLQGAVAVPPTTLALTDFPHVPPPPEATFQRPGKGASKTGGKAEVCSRRSRSTSLPMMAALFASSSTKRKVSSFTACPHVKRPGSEPVVACGLLLRTWIVRLGRGQRMPSSHMFQ